VVERALIFFVSKYIRTNYKKKKKKMLASNGDEPVWGAGYCDNLDYNSGPYREGRGHWICFGGGLDGEPFWAAYPKAYNECLDQAKYHNVPPGYETELWCGGWPTGYKGWPQWGPIFPVSMPLNPPVNGPVNEGGVGLGVMFALGLGLIAYYFYSGGTV
jgi:hypothetical protein